MIRPSLRLAAPLALALLSGCGLGSANLRDDDGQLAPCTGAPRCVSSLSRDPARYIEPIRYPGSLVQARHHLLVVLAERGDARVVEEQLNYLRAEVTTPLLRFIDDLEFVMAPESETVTRIDVRSSSRIGYYDFQTNRLRLEAIRAALRDTPAPTR
ncbi:MAG TPA: DUF1499 domain-containing protein [Nevskiaceae bacterium]|nr:DUF1499 domain-containing protein [Nevskiaceae bacterium]